MDNLITEFWKIKRYSVIKAGAAMMFLSVFMSYFTRRPVPLSAGILTILFIRWFSKIVRIFFLW